jgi:hypothetical protein
MWCPIVHDTKLTIVEMAMMHITTSLSVSANKKRTFFPKKLAVRIAKKTISTTIKNEKIIVRTKQNVLIALARFDCEDFSWSSSKVLVWLSIELSILFRPFQMK